MGMKIQDAYNLERSLRKTKSLIFLSLPNNLIEKEILNILINGLIGNNSICYIDLSHNMIDDSGAKIISKFLQTNNVLISLDLSFNQIRKNGPIYLSQSLKSNKSLQSLNLKHNRIEDNSGGKMCSILNLNSTLKELILSYNGLSNEFSQDFCELLKNVNSGLIKITLCCNQIAEKDGIKIYNALLENKNILLLDLKNNKLSQKTLSEISLIVEKNLKSMDFVPPEKNYRLIQLYSMKQNHIENDN